MKIAAILVIALGLGGCLADGTSTANSGAPRGASPSAASSPPARSAKEEDADKPPRQLCESTLEGNDARTVCY